MEVECESHLQLKVIRISDVELRSGDEVLLAMIKPQGFLVSRLYDPGNNFGNLHFKVGDSPYPP
jgi:hypothetical protein